MKMTNFQIDIKEAVMNNRKVTFSYYRDGALWYITHFGDLFSVPIDDIGNATFLAEDKALLFMRYMRKYNEQISEMTK